MKEERETPRTVGCMCGYRAEAADDPDLRRLIRHHVDRAHLELAFTDEQIRWWVASGARDASPPGPVRLRAREKEVVERGRDALKGTQHRAGRRRQ